MNNSGWRDLRPEWKRALTSWNSVTANFDAKQLSACADSWSRDCGWKRAMASMKHFVLQPTLMWMGPSVCTVTCEADRPETRVKRSSDISETFCATANFDVKRPLACTALCYSELQHTHLLTQTTSWVVLRHVTIGMCTYFIWLAGEVYAVFILTGMAYGLGVVVVSKHSSKTLMLYITFLQSQTVSQSQKLFLINIFNCLKMYSLLLQVNFCCCTVAFCVDEWCR